MVHRHGERVRTARARSLRGIRAVQITVLGGFCIVLALAALPAAAQPVPQGQSIVQPQPGNPAIEQRFMIGLGLLNAGRPDGAIPVFLSILASDPTLVRVRLELARAYFEAEQWSRARQEFFRVLSTDLPDSVRARVLGFIRAIDARRGFDWDLSVGVTTLGNRRRYDSDTVDLDVGFGAVPFTLDRSTESAIGMRITGDMTYRRALEQSMITAANTVAFAGLDLDLLDGPGSQFDDITFGLRAGLRFLGSRTSVAVTGFGRTRHVAGDAVEDRFGAEVSFERRTGFGGAMFGAVALARLDSAIAEDRDGHVVQALLGVRQSVGGRASLGTSIRVEENRVAFDLENYRDTEWRVFGSYDAAYGISLSPSLSVRYRDFRAPSPLFTASPDERALALELTLEKTDLFLGDGFSPFVTVGYTRVTSDIAAFAYDETQMRIGLERRF